MRWCTQSKHPRSVFSREVSDRSAGGQAYLRACLICVPFSRVPRTLILRRQCRTRRFGVTFGEGYGTFCPGNGRYFGNPDSPQVGVDQRPLSNGSHLVLDWGYGGCRTVIWNECQLTRTGSPAQPRARAKPPPKPPKRNNLLGIRYCLRTKRPAVRLIM